MIAWQSIDNALHALIYKTSRLMQQKVPDYRRNTEFRQDPGAPLSLAAARNK